MAQGFAKIGLGPTGPTGPAGATGPTGPQGPAGVGGGGPGGTYATQATPGLIQLAGDLAGRNSTASAPTISNISGDASYAVGIPSGVNFISSGAFKFTAIGASGAVAVFNDGFINNFFVSVGTGDSYFGGDLIIGQAVVPTFIPYPETTLAVLDNANTFSQINIHNYNAGAKASTDIVVENDLSTNSSNYLDLGINSSGYSGGASGAIGGYANDNYLYASNKSLWIGLAETGVPTNAIKFFTQGSQSPVVQIYNDGGLQVGKGMATSPGTGTIGAFSFQLYNNQNSILDFNLQSGVGSTYTINWPISGGSSGMGMQSDGLGNLSWVYPINYLGGDLGGRSSTATAPTIDAITGDVSGFVQIPSGTILYFGASATSAQTGLMRFPAKPLGDAPIIAYSGQSGTVIAMSYGRDTTYAGSPYDSVTVGYGELNGGNDLLKFGAQYKMLFRVNSASGMNALGRDAIEIGRTADIMAPYLGIHGPSGATGMMTFQVQSGVASYVLKWPPTMGASGTVLSTDVNGVLSWVAGGGGVGAPGATGPTGPAGTAGANSASPIWFNNGGITVGAFSNIILNGGLQVATAAAGAIITDIPDFLQVGLTGANLATTSQASTCLVQWTFSDPNYKFGNNIGNTTIGTAAGIITIQKAGYYEIKSQINFTGVGSGLACEIQQFLGATGISGGRYTYGTGTPIAQSVAYSTSKVTVSTVTGLQWQTVNNNYIVYIPSGTNIETYARMMNIAGAHAPTAPALAATGTIFSIRRIN